MNEINRDYSFRVVRNVYYRLGQETNETVYTYEIEFKKIQEEEFTVELRKFNYRTDGIDFESAKIVESILREYSNEFFPVLLHIKEDVISIVNKEDIHKRIEKKNSELRIVPEYLIDKKTAKIKNITRHHVIDDIKEFFLKKTTNDYIMENSCSKGMMELLLFSLGKIKNDNAYDLKFNLGPFDSKIKWECKKKPGHDVNIIRYTGRIKKRNKLLKKINKHVELGNNSLNAIKCQENLYSKLKHEVHFDPRTKLFDFFEMNIKIRHDFYDYKETIYISAINKKTKP